MVGKLRNWWKPSTEEEYAKRAQCVIDQYGNYTVEQVGLNLNGINTQGENIADNGGINAAYAHYPRIQSLALIVKQKSYPVPFRF